MLLQGKRKKVSSLGNSILPVQVLTACPLPAPVTVRAHRTMQKGELSRRHSEAPLAGGSGFSKQPQAASLHGRAAANSLLLFLHGYFERFLVLKNSLLFEEFFIISLSFFLSLIPSFSNLLFSLWFITVTGQLVVG